MNDLLKLEYLSFLDKRIQKLDSYLFTSREKDVVFLINKGLRNRKIAEILYISETTVKKHVYNVFIKANINSRIELICLLRDESIKNYLSVAS